MSGAIADTESHAHLSFMDVITVPLNMADSMEIFIIACLMYTIPSMGRGAEHSEPLKVKYQRLQQLLQW